MFCFFILILTVGKLVDWEQEVSDLGSLSESSSFVKVDFGMYGISVHVTITRVSWTTDMTHDTVTNIQYNL